MHKSGWRVIPISGIKIEFYVDSEFFKLACIEEDKEKVKFINDWDSKYLEHQFEKETKSQNKPVLKPEVRIKDRLLSLSFVI